MTNIVGLSFLGIENELQKTNLVIELICRQDTHMTNHTTKPNLT